jgi:GNAT superfamily N-acetyltransferase
VLPPGLRRAVPEDYDAIAAVVDRWWGRPILDALPRLFLDHFHRSSLVAPAGPQAPADDRGLRGFLVGFASPSLPDEAYIHFVGVAPDERGSGLGRLLYETFFDQARAAGRNRVAAVTSPVNRPSIAFHRSMGFDVSAAISGYNGPGHDLVTFHRDL